MIANGIPGREEIAPAALRAQLQRIVSCREFDASDRNRRFLQHVVEETLAGRAERIKAYSIATSTFGRDASFDPAADPIVRIEAGRLRRSLERYYLTVGQHDPIRIDIPKGSYVPAFRPAPSRPAAANRPASDAPGPGPLTAGPWPPAAGTAAMIAATASARRPGIRARHIAAPLCLLGALLLAWIGIAWSGPYPPFSPSRPAAAPADRAPAIFVAAFDNDGGDASADGLVRGFTREVIVGLTRFEGVSVYGPEPSIRPGAGDDPNPGRGLPVAFVLTGGVSVSEHRFRVAALLVDARTGRNFWSSVFEHDITAGDAFDARASIANQIALALAQPDGILFSRTDKNVGEKSATVLASSVTARP
jgi:adenylate cyclase